eukprot:TRINITY_DN4059_c0_g2_i1.p1 TRINITY_DN4059_c0_g2~~TRINITY_DN4059_c0_g2_i1.p1  ORF type:complete len:255 (-),score=19.69 TRINITY_DN4059_c0_g2_i1:200-964(-)
MSVKRINVRHGYLFSPEHRPKLRGALVGWLHSSKMWLCIITAYVLIFGWNTSFPVKEVLPRIAFACATWWCTWLSDWLHNLDLKMGEKASSDVEFHFYRQDLLSISVILTTQFFLWAANCGWSVGTGQAIANGCASLLVFCLLFGSKHVAIRHHDGIVAVVKVVYGIQFLMLGWLGYLYAYHTNCGMATFIWFVYLPGFVFYVLKTRLRDFEIFGPHEIFHSFVYAGHMLTMGIDTFMSLPNSECQAGSVLITR